MSLSHSPELNHLLSTYFADLEAEQDEQAVLAFLATADAAYQARALEQLISLQKSENLVESLGMTANRWFGSDSEAKEWLQSIEQKLMQTGDAETTLVKDSNGATLVGGDSVTVIKDLKVKGGSSDLKRGTLIKKIRLIGDPANIECNVDGSTLVLKTIFLKKV